MAQRRTNAASGCHIVGTSTVQVSAARNRASLSPWHPAGSANESRVHPSATHLSKYGIDGGPVQALGDEPAVDTQAGKPHTVHGIVTCRAAEATVLLKH